VSRSDIKNGNHLHSIPEAELDELPPQYVPQPTRLPMSAIRPPTVFHYHRVGMTKPHVVEFSNGLGMLDGNQLSNRELHTILRNVNNGVATLRYKNGQQESLVKAEQLFQNLLKEEDEMDINAAFGHLQRLVEAGHLDPKVAQTLRGSVWGDRMVPSMGSKFAADDFLQKNKPGVYASMDGNDFKSVNDLHGHGAGDAAIKTFGSVLRESMDEAVGRDKGKLFRNPDEQDLYRNGGDEFIAHFPSHEHAARFARTLHQKLNDLAPINGVHRLSMSIGLGPSFDHADKALLEAKKQKYHPNTKDRKYKVGETPNFAHSLMPGNEGPVPLDPTLLPTAHLQPNTQVKVPEAPPTPEPKLAVNS
jgi:GGDEF domain-containing protein